ncbi:terminase large subunit domain-containing protein [Brevundimonas sp.]|uniref:terminase large subunit domain-containing protein n=1 Tax=Brevundimonas sp. TaxID=1871086 RepID=UPI002898B88C|nr:terminase large subunit [Brevundimonas sp.]
MDVVAGRIISGELGGLAAERHLRDLRDGPARGLHFDIASASRALGFFPAVLSITAGAMEGQPFHPLPWHTFTIGSLFGWKKESGRLRFRQAWLETGKGQAKSPLMAAIGLYMMGWHGVRRSEIYAIGQDRATANVLFKDAVAMCRANMPETPEDETDSLVSRGEVLIRGEGDNAWKIEHPETESKFQALANGEAISGPRPTLVTADEIHEFKAATSIETWRRAIAKMPGDASLFRAVMSRVSRPSRLRPWIARPAAGRPRGYGAATILAGSRWASSSRARPCMRMRWPQRRRRGLRRAVTGAA